MAMDRLEGWAALITGAGSGIGREPQSRMWDSAPPTCPQLNQPLSWAS